jgi:transposase
MYYIGLDLHKQTISKTISYCVKEANGRIVAEGSILATRAALDGFIDQLPKPWSAAMDATLFTGWVYDHLAVHSAAVKVANPLMLSVHLTVGTVLLLRP